MSKRNRTATTKRVAWYLAVFLLLAGMTLAFAIAAGNAMDRSVDMHNINLCDSAKVSGNYEVQKKCDCFYRTGEYHYLREVMAK